MPSPPPLGALGCCLFSCPTGLIPGDTLPLATSSCLLSSVSSAWSCGGLRAGWRPRPPTIRELAGLGEGSLPPCVGEQAWARKPPAFMSLAGLCSGCWLPGRLPGGQS